eukprot:5819173-Pyramimonas_sp.AAC.1
MSFGSKTDDKSRAVPDTPQELINAAFSKYVSATTDSGMLELGQYSWLDDQKAARPNDLMKFKVLVVELFRAEHRGIFKPIALQAALQQM